MSLEVSDSGNSALAGGLLLVLDELVDIFGEEHLARLCLDGDAAALLG